MVMIPFEMLLDRLQRPELIPENLLRSQVGLSFRGSHFAPPQCTLEMQHISLKDLDNLLKQDAFQLLGVGPDSSSFTIAILMVFCLDAALTKIEHIFIGLVVFYEQDGICPFMTSVRSELKYTRERRAAAGECKLMWSYAMLVGNFGGVMVIPTKSPHTAWFTPTPTLTASLPSTNAPSWCSSGYRYQLMQWFLYPSMSRSTSISGLIQ